MRPPDDVRREIELRAREALWSVPTLETWRWLRLDMMLRATPEERP